MRKLLLTAAVVCGLVVGVGSAAASGTTATAVSTNWSGYAVTGASPFTAVSASWVQPTASCTAGKTTSSAFWVGLGGFGRSSTSLEQIGTDADCDARGNVSYSSWWEILPAASVPLTVAVSSGDTISASVTVDGTTVSFQLQNVTQGTSFSKQVTMSSPDTTSAEWIAEAPSLCPHGMSSCQTQPLTNFGNVTFSAASTIAAGHTGSISDEAWATTQVSLRNGTSAFSRWRGATTPAGAGAVPAELSPDGASFSVAWQGTPATPSASPAPAPSQPRVAPRPWRRGWGGRWHR